MKKIILTLISILLILPLWYYYNVINADNNIAGATKEFTISKGESVDTIVANLETAGLIKCPLCLKIYLKLSGNQTKIMAGSYAIEPGQNAKEIIALLAQGKIIANETNIKIIEGWSINDIDYYLNEQKLFAPGAFKQLAGNSISQLPFNFERSDILADVPATASLEGFLFPDTYRIFKDSTPSAVIEKMLDNFNGKVDAAMRQDIAAQGKTLYEIVTMASIIEKEVRTYEDMQIVSGVFWDRIKNNQALESCATLAYILGEDKKQYTKEDTLVESAYNTYQNRGLPPGPICNPGLNAIKASIYPKYSDYNYFLTRNDNGQTVFSVTYEEHLANKAKYLR